MSRDPDKPRKLHRPSREEREEINCTVDSLLAGRVHTHVIKKVLAASHALKWRAAERAIASGRQRMLKDTGRKRSDHRAEAVASLNAVYCDSTATPLVKIRAIEALAKLLGLNKPQIVHVHGGVDPAMAALTETRQAMVADPVTNELLLKLSERAAGLFPDAQKPQPGLKELPAHDGATTPSTPKASPGDLVRRAFKKNGTNGHASN